jgi:hypothetical protein
MSDGADYRIDLSDYGVPKARGESWDDAAQRLREQRPYDCDQRGGDDG